MKPQFWSYIKIIRIATLSLVIIFTNSINAQQLKVEGVSGQNSLEIIESGFSGILIDSTLRHGMVINNTSLNGIYLTDIGQDGIAIEGAQANGISISNVTGDGIEVSDGDIGIDLNNQELYGIRISDPVNFGLSIINSGQSGVTVANSNADGVYISDAADDGIQIVNSGDDAITIFSPTNDGVHVDAGKIGLRAQNQSQYGILVEYSGYDGIFVNGSNKNGLTLLNSNEIGLQISNTILEGVKVNGAGTRAASFVNDNTSLEESVYIAHGSDSRVDLRFGGSAKIETARDFKIQLDSNDDELNTYFQINRSLQDGGGDVFEVYESGNAAVLGNLSKGGGSFKIDHPLDPENKYLYHSFVESPDMMNVYNGNIVTDENGLAEVELPEYFEALNYDFKYQLTVIGVFAQAIIKEELIGNTFSIQSDKPNIKVSWLITGIRHDPFANQNRIEVEVDKVGEERGKYLHPEAKNSVKRKSGISPLNQEVKKQTSIKSLK
jgi:uncharacterized protein YjbI with pentapeptide repeats